MHALMHALVHALGTDTFRQRSNFDWHRTQSWAQVNDTLQCDFQRGVFFQHKLAGGFARRKRRPHPSFVPPRACEFARVCGLSQQHDAESVRVYFSI